MLTIPKNAPLSLDLNAIKKVKFHNEFDTIGAVCSPVCQLLANANERNRKLLFTLL